jgi:hypothetical protein
MKTLSLKDILEAVDKISDKEAMMSFDKLKDKDIDNDGDVDSSDKYLKKKLGVVALKTEASTSDTITFSIDDDKLDTLLHAKFANYIDYTEDDGLDSYYTLPKRHFDRFIDLADSSGFNTDKLIQLKEDSTTANVPGYQTPYAFGKVDKKDLEDMGYKVVGKSDKNESLYKQMMNQCNLNYVMVDAIDELWELEDLTPLLNIEDSYFDDEFLEGLKTIVERKYDVDDVLDKISRSSYQSLNVLNKHILNKKSR